MLDVVCGRCGQTFEAADDAVEEGEVCPYCGAAVEEDAVEPLVEFRPAQPATIDIKPPERGIPGPLWWFAVIVIVAAFVLAVVSMLQGDNWEQQHLQELADADKKASAFMVIGDYRHAADEFQSIVDELSGRQIQSIYLRELLDRAQQGEGDARHRLALAATQPATPAVAGAATAPGAPPAAPASAEIPQNAIIDFQRRAESFSQFTRSHPLVYQDSHGDWRRREFLVWNVEAELETPDEGEYMSLKYSSNSRITAEHNLEEDAAGDINFLYDEHEDAIQCESRYYYRGGVWVAAPRDTDLQAQDNSVIRDGTIKPETILDLSDLRVLEAEHFAGGSGSR